MKKQKGVTLLALIITIIILLLLAGVTSSLFSGNSLIGNTQSAVEQSKIESKKTEIEQAIISKMIKEDRDITIDQIIEELEKKGIINEGDGDSNSGQVKTQPDGYIYEIKEDENGNWEVIYIGKGEIDKTAITISVEGNTSGLTGKVTLTIKANSGVGITKYTDARGSVKTYSNGTTSIEETYEVTENGSYTFTVENSSGKTASKTVEISNILEGTIQISATPSTPTKNNVTVTVVWPSGSERGIKEISTNGGTTWQTVTGETSEVEVTSNGTIKARVKNSTEDITTATLEINNIDKTNPTVTATVGKETITEGDSNELSKYFTYKANGTTGIASIVYTDTSKGNVEVTNTNTLAVGTHVIKCTVTKETGAVASATKTIVVEKAGPEVDASGLATENVTIKPDANSNLQIVIPTGFAPAILATGTTQSGPGEDGSVASIMPAEEWNNITVEQINKGIVIVDHAITYTGTVPDFNEYVWVPIPESSNFARTAWTIGSSATAQNLAEASTSNAFWEDKTTTEYTSMVDSVEYYKGFYIGRYEASNNGASIAQSKRNQTAWISIAQTTAKTASTNNSTQNMHLIYGIEWDSALNWLIGNAQISSSTSGVTKTMETADVQTNSYSWGNYSTSTGDAAIGSATKRTTGYSEYWKANNIYDLAGNVWEWTQEKYSTGTLRISRGGEYYEDSYPVAMRYAHDESNTYDSRRIPL